MRQPLIERFREWLARKLIELAIMADPGNITICQSGKYRLDIGWTQPMRNDSAQLSRHGNNA